MALLYLHGGERGIRTLEGFHLTAFRERPVQPLLHLSNFFIVTDEANVFARAILQIIK